jgi:phage host-nuclease inhibitor protein Gam
MSKKTKKQDEQTISIDGVEHKVSDLTESQIQMVNHVQDMQNKLNTNAFIRTQLEVGKEAFVNMLKGSLG